MRFLTIDEVYISRLFCMKLICLRQVFLGKRLEKSA